MRKNQFRTIMIFRWTTPRFNRHFFAFQVICLALLQVLLFQSVDAQSTEQIWLEYKPTYSFANGYKLAMRASYRTNLEEPLWRVWEFRLMPEKKLSKHFDVLASLQFLETVQFKELTTSEIRLAAGGRYHFLPGRIQRIRLPIVSKT